MERREAVRYISLLLGGTLIGAETFISGCKSKSNSDTNAEFSDRQIAYLDEIAETILPETKTPGAKAARVGQFMAMMVSDVYEEKNKKIFKDGMENIQVQSNKEFGKDFMSVSAEQRKSLLVKLDNEQKEITKNSKPGDSPHYFRLMKELTLLGYFTSEIGCIKARRYVETPGAYQACIPYKKGDKAWA